MSALKDYPRPIPLSFNRSCNKQAALLVSAGLLRCFLFGAFPSLPSHLAGRLELSTPLNSFKRLQEGLFLYKQVGISSMYDGKICHQPPFLIALFSILDHPSLVDLHQWPVYFLFIALDLFSAHRLMVVAASASSTRCTNGMTSLRESLRWSTIAIGASFLFNPFTILTCLARSTSSFTTAAILSTTASAVKVNLFELILTITFSFYLSMYPVLLLPPLLVLCYSSRVAVAGGPLACRNTTNSAAAAAAVDVVTATSTSDQDRLGQSLFAEEITTVAKAVATPKPPPPLPILTYRHQLSKPKLNVFTFTAISVAAFIGMCILFLIMNLSFTRSVAFISATYEFHMLATDLSPNMGLWWYFFTEIFDPFRNFFLSVFWTHLGSYVGGFTIKMSNQPLLAVVVMTGIFAIFLPYPSFADVSLFMAGAALFSHSLPLMRYSFISCAILLYALVLGPTFYHLWISIGSGNANFFYAITLVWALALVLILGDLLYAVLRDRWEMEHPQYAGKPVRMV